MSAPLHTTNFVLQLQALQQTSTLTQVDDNFQDLYRHDLPIQQFESRHVNNRILLGRTCRYHRYKMSRRQGISYKRKRGEVDVNMD
jgi:hypothetical protein